MNRYAHDTRTMQAGDYYVAIRGERFDGHRFIPDALHKGAAGLVVERDISEYAVPAHIDVIRVASSIDYLGELARERLAELGCNVVAITGSVGKTTAKAAAVTVLQQAFEVVTPQGNWNTLLGLSLTVLNQLTSPQQTFVTEIGIYHEGEIAHVCRYIQPHIGVVLNVQPVHLETMGTIETIARAKGEMAEAVRPEGVACLNYDDPRVRAMAARTRGRVVFYGSDPAADITPTRITADIPLLGTYKTSTALVAFSIATCFGMSDEQINQGLTQLAPPKGRLVMLPGVADTTLIDDTYNASLSSSLAALEALAHQPATRRIAIMGDMLELGSSEEQAHRDVLAQARNVADLLILVGPRFERAMQQLDLAPQPALSHFADVQAALAELQTGTRYQPATGDVVLFKGSAGMRIEHLVRHYLRPDLDPAAVLVRQEANWRGV
jgi:UDP-N-acetylmuramoyl-tripeptide--D-alanyl-D-alanine ligase